MSDRHAVKQLAGARKSLVQRLLDQRKKPLESNVRTLRQVNDSES